MFPRNISRAAARRCFAAPSSNTISRASFQTAARLQTPPETVQERHVPVSHWKDGQRSQAMLPVSESNEPVNPPGADEVVTAQPLKPAVMAQLTPTMAKFTLPGKVAVVTG